ncbi:MAG: hypothetical protein ACO1NQ_09720 [Flavobacteriales bacterium]
MMRRDLLWGLASIGFAALLVFIWHLASAYKLVAPVFLPPPGAAFQALVIGMQDGRLSSATAETLERIFLGWLLASGLGIVIGAGEPFPVLRRTDANTAARAQRFAEEHLTKRAFDEAYGRVLKALA